ncbi:MAG: hypothetical protein KAS32_23410 [Candidatus Peribacteraceae bacterium]|nr:hypothetical protein [Candidatus Peribacteraceae bacterium]
MGKCNLNQCKSSYAICKHCPGEAEKELFAPPTSLASDNKKIDRLRGQLQNCINHLELLKRHGYANDVRKIDLCVDSANKALYETHLR